MESGSEANCYAGNICTESVNVLFHLIIRNTSDQSEMLNACFIQVFILEMLMFLAKLPFAAMLPLSHADHLCSYELYEEANAVWINHPYGALEKWEK